MDDQPQVFFINVLLPPEIYHRLEKESVRKEVSIEDIANRAIRLYLPKLEEWRGALP
jgi:hypothetical protein